MLKFD
ncbi:Protein of unknown function [Lactobacillus delbrueckii subsp. bulgaricus]